MSCEKDSNLTKDEAIHRRTVLSPGIIYRVFLDLQKGKCFNGVIHVTFNVQQAESTFIEFAGKKIIKMTINKKTIEDYKWEKGYISIDQGHIKQGENTLVVHFENEYFNDGNGLHSFIDDQGNQYVHSQGEPHSCNRIFPVFDQPDLKGHYELAVRAPQSWEVISNEIPAYSQIWNEWVKGQDQDSASNLDFYAIVREIFQGLESSDANFIHFRRTDLLPCYLYTVIFGDFRKIECPKEELHRDIPQTIYCKKNMADFAKEQSKTIFELNSKGTAKYEEIFGYLYPFSKCDTIFCPEYSAGAMENPGAITYNENYLFSSVPTRSQETNRASTILHELAHMWFGDLVTMKWWDDLWLNESFADFVCYLNMHLIRPSLTFALDDAWMCMHDGKSAGYNDDGSESTTHPIYAEVPDIETTESIFDGITYNKGASVLKQLYSLVGHDNFSKAMKSYFLKHQWKNTELKDLLSEFSVILDEKDKGCYNLDKFRQDWIETAGHNVLSCHWTESSLKMTISQRPHLIKYPTLRYHKIKVGMYGDNGKLLRTLDVIVNNIEATYVDCGDMSQVKAVLLNYDDLDFVKIEIDEASFHWIKSNFTKIDEQISKALIARALFDQVKQANTIKNYEYLMVYEDVLKQETCTTIVAMMDGFASEILSDYSSEDIRKRFSSGIFKAAHDKLRETRDDEMVKLLTSMLVSYAIPAASDVEFGALYDIYTEKDPAFSHVALTLTQKWRIVLRLQSWSKLSVDDRNKLVDDIAAQDTTDKKTTYKLMIKGLNMSDEDRSKLLESIDKDTHGLSFDSLSYLLVGFNHRLVPAKRREPYHEEFFAKMPEWIEKKSHELSKTICEDLMPMTEDLVTLNDRLEAMISKTNNKYFIRSFKSQIDENRVAKKIIDFEKYGLESN